jgi:hypothetical protein
MFRQQHPDARMLERLVSCALRTPVPNIPVPPHPQNGNYSITQA